MRAKNADTYLTRVARGSVSWGHWLYDPKRDELEHKDGYVISLAQRQPLDGASVWLCLAHPVRDLHRFSSSDIGYLARALADITDAWAAVGRGADDVHAA